MVLPNLFFAPTKKLGRRVPPHEPGALTIMVQVGSRSAGIGNSPAFHIRHAPVLALSPIGLISLSYHDRTLSIKG